MVRAQIAVWTMLPDFIVATTVRSMQTISAVSRRDAWHARFTECGYQAAASTPTIGRCLLSLTRTSKHVKISQCTATTWIVSF